MRGGTPRTRLNAFEKANSHSYPTARATFASVWFVSRSCHAAMRSRCLVSQRSGEIPAARTKRRAKAARERPAIVASAATLQALVGSADIASMVGRTRGSTMRCRVGFIDHILEQRWRVRTVAQPDTPE